MRRILAMCAVLLSCAAQAMAQGATISCESIDGHYRECRGGSAGKAVLTMELSDNRCIEGTTYGTRMEGVVWVDAGCRGRFSLRGGSLTGSRRIVCESQKGTLEWCPAELNNVADPKVGLSLVRQLGEKKCVEGESWGYEIERDQLWVDKGCRGEFMIGHANPLKAVEALDATVVCETKNRQRVECAADTAAGVRIVRTLNDTTCGYGKQWGYDDRGIWVSGGCRAEFAIRGVPKPTIQAVTCESHNDARADCPAETHYGVALVRVTGEKECVLGKSWGFDDKGVWVTEGCRGQFALGGYRLPATAKLPPTAMKLVCESADGQRKVCEVDASHGVGLLRQISEKDCVLNRSWGYGRDGIWVSEGCRAEFVVAK
ncbi:MAG: hypothetical protein QOC81_4834 [Thermoanaerobaculia bacterium]|jgi:hypothetical protein|nr:hypothetical protein [Thermoanaerobaculia bacterium]